MKWIAGFSGFNCLLSPLAFDFMNIDRWFTNISSFAASQPPNKRSITGQLRVQTALLAAFSFLVMIVYTAELDFR